MGSCTGRCHCLRRYLHRCSDDSRYVDAAWDASKGAAMGGPPPPDAGAAPAMPPRPTVNPVPLWPAPTAAIPTPAGGPGKTTAAPGAVPGNPPSPPRPATPGTTIPGRGRGKFGVVVPPGRRPTWEGGVATGTGVGRRVAGAPAKPTRFKEAEGDPYLRGNVMRRWTRV